LLERAAGQDGDAERLEMPGSRYAHSRAGLVSASDWPALNAE
jgi:hypothetical protein